MAPPAACGTALKAQLAVAAVVVELLGEAAHERQGLAVAGFALRRHLSPLSDTIPLLIIAANRLSLASPRLAPQDCDGPVSEVAEAGHDRDLGVLHLALARLGAKLSHGFEEVVHPQHVRLGEQPAVRIDRELPADQAKAFGGISNRFLVTTEGGGASEYLGWSYNHENKWVASGKCTVRFETIAEWEPLEED